MFKSGSVDATVFEQEAVSDGWQYFFDVMRDHDEGGGLRFRSEGLHPWQVMFTSDGIQPGAGFIEDKDGKFSHQCTANENFLLFTL